MPLRKKTKQFIFEQEFNLEDEFEKDKKAMGLEDDDEDAADRMSKNIGARALKDAEDLKAIPTTKDLAAFYKNEKGYKYYIKDNKWRGIIVKNNKEFDVMKYPSTVEKLNKEFGTNIAAKKDAENKTKKQTKSEFSKEEYENLDVEWTGTGDYNSEGIALIKKEIEKNKNKYPILRNPYFQVAIYSKIAVECRFTPTIEKNYKTVSRAKEKFSALRALSDEQVKALINKPEEFWEYVYGLGQAVNVGGIDIPAKSSKNSLGNTEKGDGYKYRGRGYVQFTGRYQYRKYGKLAGVDGINNPDSFTEPANAAKLAIPRIIAGVKIFGGGIKDYKDQESANAAVTYSIAGSKPSSGAFGRTASHNKNFKIIKKEEKRAMSERKIISEKNLRYFMRSLIKENINERKPQSEEEGNEFRKWVNDNIPKNEIEALFDFSSDKKLDLEGSIDNSHFNTAWEKFGEEYLEASTSVPEDTREFDFYPSTTPDKMQPAGRGIPEPYFKFRKGDVNDPSMETFGMTAGGDIYYTSNTDPDIEKDEAGRFKFIKLNESRSIKKVLINESRTKARIVLENISATKKFDLTKEFMKDLDALGLTDDLVPGVVQAKGGADAKVAKMEPGKAAKGKGTGSSDWAQHIQRGHTGLQRKDAQSALGQFIPADVEGKSFLDWAIGYWAARKPTSHRSGLGFDFVPLGGSSYKDINKVIIEFKKHASGMLPWDETGKGKGVTWNKNSPVGSPNNKGAHYHFTIQPTFKIKSSGEELIKSQGIDGQTVDHVIGHGTKHYKLLKSVGRKAFLLFGAVCKKLGYKVMCTSSLRTPESQVRIMLQQAAGRELEEGTGIDWLLQYGKHGVAFGNALKNGSVQKALT